MASNIYSKKTEAHHKDFILRKTGNFWILLSRNKTKRLTFLDNAKNVVIDDNILIADDKLFEIFKDKEGQFSFRKIEDVSCESDNNWKEEVGEQNDENPQKTEAEKINDSMETFADLTDNQKKSRNRLDEEKEDVDDKNSSTELVFHTRGAYIDVDSSAYNESHETDISLGSTEEVVYYDLDSVQKEGALYESLITEENRNTTKSQVTENSLNRPQEMCQTFDVEVESTDLAKLCGIKGRMRLLLRKYDLAFEDPITGRIVYCFNKPWIRRFGIDGSKTFCFEVGRKCPYGQGSIDCKTKNANRIYAMVGKKSHEISKQIATNKTS